MYYNVGLRPVRGGGQDRAPGTCQGMESQNSGDSSIDLPGLNLACLVAQNPAKFTYSLINLYANDERKILTKQRQTKWHDRFAINHRWRRHYQRCYVTWNHRRTRQGGRGGGGQLPSQIRAKQWGKSGQSKKKKKLCLKFRANQPLSPHTPMRETFIIFTSLVTGLGLIIFDMADGSTWTHKWWMLGI